VLLLFELPLVRIACSRRAFVLSVGLLEYQGEGVGSARVADLLLESLFDTQNSLVDLVQPVGLILGLLSGRDVGFHCGFFRGCFGCLVSIS